VDNQQTVEIHILQGEREISKENRSLARFELVGIEPAPRGVPQIDVTFEIDANGIVSVSARDKNTGQEQAMQITASSGLAPDEIDRLIREAEESVEKDKETRGIILQKNRLESLLTSTRRAMSEIGGSFTPEQMQTINRVLNDAEGYLTSDKPADIQAAMIKVEEMAAKITEAMLSMA